MAEKTDNQLADFLRQQAAANSVEDKTRLADALSELMNSSYDSLSDKERHLAFNILQNIIHEVEHEIRRKLGEVLSTRDNAHRDVVMKLANDDIDIAYPVLQKSKVLNDKDLVEIIRLRTHEYHLAITARETLSEDVSDAIVDTGDCGVIESLLKNQNAEISKSTMAYLVDESKRVDSFQSPLLHRHDLEQDLAKKMFLWVSEALRDFIVERYEISDEEVFELLNLASSTSLKETLEENARTPRPAQRLVKDLKTEGLVTPNMLNAALRDGEVALFFSMLSEMAQIDETEIKSIVFEPDGKRMIILCKALDVPEFQFGLIYRTSRNASPGLRKRLKEDLNDALAIFRKLERAQAVGLVEKWRNLYRIAAHG